MATINDLYALTTATANDLLAIWDAEAGSGVEPTKKITFQNLVKSMVATISLSENYACSSANYEYTGVSVTIPANSIYSIFTQGVFSNSLPTGTLISYSSSDINSYNVPAKSAQGATGCSISGYATSQFTIYIWAAWSGASTNLVAANGFYIPLG